MSKTHYDCSGYATKADMRCSDGRTIRKNAFEECEWKKSSAKCGITNITILMLCLDTRFLKTDLTEYTHTCVQ